MRQLPGSFSQGGVVAEECKESPMVSKRTRQAQDTQMFLKMAASELRRIAGKAPEIAAELHDLALQMEAEAHGQGRHRDKRNGRKPN
jgi:hypothetical protein